METASYSSVCRKYNTQRSPDYPFPPSLLLSHLTSWCLSLRLCVVFACHLRVSNTVVAVVCGWFRLFSLLVKRLSRVRNEGRATGSCMQFSMTRHIRCIQTLSDFIWACSTPGTQHNLRNIGDKLPPRYAACGCNSTTLVYATLIFPLRQSFTEFV